MVEASVPTQNADDVPAFRNWLIVWLLLINLPFCLMWYFGAPIRGVEIALAGIIGLIARPMGTVQQGLAFIGVMGFSLVSFLAGMFNLKRTEIIESVQLASELKLQNSIEYLIGIFLVLLVVFGALFFIRRGTNFKSDKFSFLATALVMVLVFIDYKISVNVQGHYRKTAPPNAAFQSARTLSGFAKEIKSDRHYILIVVESLGRPVNNPEMQKHLFAPFEDERLKDNYVISSGTTPFYKSTTAAEIRELCGRWDGYKKLRNQADPTCLPHQFLQKGFETLAIHGFTEKFFDREAWYPNIGFNQSQFRDSLLKTGIPVCPGVFTGACDRYVPEHILKTLQQADQPTFLYWLTLNTHVPVPAVDIVGTTNCEKFSPELARDYPIICRQLSVFKDVDQALVAMMTNQDFPKSDILIVGDHMPPFMDRHHRTQFEPDRVPWLYLEAK